jgi:hypothetical protein
LILHRLAQGTWASYAPARDAASSSTSSASVCCYPLVFSRFCTACSWLTDY